MDKSFLHHFSPSSNIQNQNKLSQKNSETLTTQDACQVHRSVAGRLKRQPFYPNLVLSGAK
jgi:hypothetical protein